MISLRFKWNERNGQEPKLRKGGSIDEEIAILALQVLKVALDEILIRESGLVHWIPIDLLIR